MTRTHQKLPTNWHEREKLRNKGQFWTPEWVAQPMIEYVSKEANLIFDPAVGRGAFYDALLKSDRATETHFYGTDIDPAVLSDDIYKQ